MKILTSRFAIGLAALCFSSIIVAGECDFVPGYRHGNGGGFVALTAYVEPSVYIGSGSKVCGFNVLLGNVILDGNSEVSGFATISGKVNLKDNAIVRDYARIETDSLNNGILISNNAKITDNAVVLDRSTISDNAFIYGHAQIEGNSSIAGSSQVYGHAKISRSKILENSKIHGFSIIESNSTTQGNTEVCDDVTLTDTIIPQGNTYCEGQARIIASTSSPVASHICVIASNSGSSNKGQLYCWGDNTYGQVKFPVGGTVTYPYKVPGVSNATSVAVGSQNTCVTFDDGAAGQVRCWGNAQSGQIGDNVAGAAYRNGIAVGITNAYKLAIGFAHVCALTNDGISKKLYCWGLNSYGQVGDNTVNNRQLPTLIVGSAGLTDITAGLNYTCGVAADAGSSVARCWGNLNEGQLGTGVVSGPMPQPVTVSNLALFGNYPLRQIVAGSGHLCAYDSNFQVICWGRNESGQFGNGTTSGTLRNPTLSNFIGDNSTSLYSLGRSTCGHLKTSERLFCWGDNSSGQIGIDSSADIISNPQEIFMNSGIKLFGNNSSMSILTNSTEIMHYWGNNQRSPIPVHDDI